MVNQPKTVDTDLEKTSKATVDSGQNRFATIWVSIIVFLLLLLALLIFIIQNNTSVKIQYFNASGSISFGIAMLLSAIAGALLTFLFGTIRIVQLKSRTHKQSQL